MSAGETVNVSDGVRKEVVKTGNGRRPNAGDSITVHCMGSLCAGMKKFWSTKDPGQQPFTFKVGIGQVIKGWDEGCMTMQLGEVSRIIVAGYKGYGASGFPAWGIPANADLCFEIEILSIG